MGPLECVYRDFKKKLLKRSDFERNLLENENYHFYSHFIVLFVIIGLFPFWVFFMSISENFTVFHFYPTPIYAMTKKMIEFREQQVKMFKNTNKTSYMNF